MIELRNLVPTGTTTATPKLQYRLKHRNDYGRVYWDSWVDVPTVASDAFYYQVGERVRIGKTGYTIHWIDHVDEVLVKYGNGIVLPVKFSDISKILPGDIVEWS